MTQTDAAARNVGGQNFQVSDKAPSVDRFDTLGGPYRAAWDKVADQLQTQDDGRVTAELTRQLTQQSAPPQDAARAVVDAALRPAGRSVPTSPRTEQIAADLAAIARTDPDHARAVEAKVMDTLDAGDQSRLSQDLRTIAERSVRADTRLAAAGTAPATAPSAEQVKQTADSLLRDATVAVGGRGVGPGHNRLDVPELSYDVQQLATENPSLARAVRADLSTRLSPADAADLDRVLAGDTHFGEGIGTALNHPVDGVIGAGKGLLNGVLAIGDLFARGSSLQAAGQADQAAGIQALFGQNEQSARSTQSADALRAAGSTTMIGQIPYDNVAQAGGGDIGTIADVAMAGKGLIAGGAKLVARNADEVARLSDEVVVTTRALDAFDEAAKNAPIDMAHILDGHLNAKGKAVGFHARPGATDPANSRMTEVTNQPNAAGVYVGKVEVRNPATDQWVAKTSNGGKSSFYPDHLSASDVEESVRHAYADALRNNAVAPNGAFAGDSGHGFQIQGYVTNGKVSTAYPVYE